MIMCVNLISPDDSRDELYLNNYALLQIKDTLARIHGVGSITIFGSEYRCGSGWIPTSSRRST